MPFSITPQTNLDRLFEICPQAVPCFLKRRMACVGCSMARFETLEGAAAIYQVDLQALLAEIQALTPTTPADQSE